MRFVVGSHSFVLAFLLSFGPGATAQIARPVTPLTLNGEPHTTQVPSYATLNTPQCDNSGVVYLRYAVAGSGSYSSRVARVESDGTTETISLAPLPDTQGDPHVFSFAATDDTSIYEIQRAESSDSSSHAKSAIEYVRFDSDGSVRSHATFNKEFIPSMLLPLPDGDFFASGVTLHRGADSVAETSVAGIFGPNAQFQHSLRNDPSLMKTAVASRQEPPDSKDFVLEGNIAKLGDDGNIYVLLADEHAKIAVVRQSGNVVRQITLHEPFEVSVANNLWASGNRLLVSYEGETADPKDSHIYVLYDALSGEVVRVYRPEFSGTPACFEDGQTLSVLLPQSSSGNMAIATADLQ